MNRLAIWATVDPGAIVIGSSESDFSIVIS